MDIALVCPDCNQRYKANAGHCHGGRYGGCCLSFDIQAGFDAHRLTDEALGRSRCLTPAERDEKGWYRTDAGFWRTLADDEAREKARAYWDGRKVEEGALSS